MSNTLHHGHRQRLKNRFLKENLDGFEYHNVLELLLFYAIPRMDTNEIAHELINQFGGISEVFDASFEDLMKVKGVSENAATLIKMIPSLSRIYIENKVSDLSFLDSSQKIGEYFIRKFIGITHELVYLLCLDSSCNIISCEILTQGTVTQANVSPRKIAELVIRYNACSVVLAHNHPRGLAIASNEDVITTIALKNALKQLDVVLLDHIIVAQNSYASLAEQGYI